MPHCNDKFVRIKILYGNFIQTYDFVIQSFLNVILYICMFNKTEGRFKPYPKHTFLIGVHFPFERCNPLKKYIQINPAFIKIVFRKSLSLLEFFFHILKLYILFGNQNTNKENISTYQAYTYLK